MLLLTALNGKSAKEVKLLIENLKCLVQETFPDRDRIVVINQVTHQPNCDRIFLKSNFSPIFFLSGYSLEVAILGADQKECGLWTRE